MSLYIDDITPSKAFRGKMISGTTSGTIGTQTTHAHGLGVIPKFYFFKTKAKVGQMYESATADATNIYVKASVASLTFDCLLFTW